jgi:hypothetical protein
MTNERARKRDIRERMTETGEPYSVAAKAVPLLTEMSPSQAFYSGLGQKDQTPLLPWVTPVINTLISTWEGDTSSLVKLGQAYNKLNERGHYFCHHQFVDKFFSENFFNLRKFKTNQLLGFFQENIDQVSRIVLNNADQKDSKDKPVGFSQSLLDLNSNISILNVLYEDFAYEKNTRTNSNNVSYRGIIDYTVIWYAYTQEERITFVEKLSQLILNMPSHQEVDKTVIYNAEYRAPETLKVDLDLQIGSRITVNLNTDDAQRMLTHYNSRMVTRAEYFLITAISKNYMVIQNMTVCEDIFIIDLANYEIAQSTNSTLFVLNSKNNDKNIKLLETLEEELDPANEDKYGLQLINTIPFIPLHVISPVNKKQLVIGTEVYIVVKNYSGILQGSIAEILAENEYRINLTRSQQADYYLKDPANKPIFKAEMLHINS